MRYDRLSDHEKTSETTRAVMRVAAFVNAAYVVLIVYVVLTLLPHVTAWIDRLTS